MRFVPSHDQPAPLHPVFSQQRASFCVEECLDPDVVYEPDDLPVGIGAARPRKFFQLPAGLGANGASAFTMMSAQRLDTQLAAGGNAGCSDPKSPLRQLTFTFKAACLTDPAIQNSVNLNMSSALAMTGYGPGSDQALTYVLGASRTYQGGPVTDDNGNCLAPNMPTPVVPPALAGPAAAVVAQIMAALANVPLAQQQQVVSNITTVLSTFLAQLAAANIGQPTVPVVVVPKTTDTTTTTTTTPASTGMSTTEKIVVGGLVGAAVLGAAVLITKHVTKKGH